MRNLYKKIELELDKIRFDKLWLGFSKMEFAIYNNNSVFLKDKEIPYDNRFLGNTSIDYEGRNLAICYIEDPEKENIQELTSLIIHEMFHAYQIFKGESRFTNDLVGLNYPRDLKNYEIKYKENKLIVEALNSKDRDTKLKILKEIIDLRMSRILRYGNIIEYELGIETIEGSAEYCGTKGLRHISEVLYEERIMKYKDILLKDILLIFDIRRISYYSGTLMLILLEQLDIEFVQEINNKNEIIFLEVAEKFNNKTIDLDTIEEIEVEKSFLDYVNRIKIKFEDFFNGNTKKYDGDFTICGYDPMNMVKEDNKIYCSHFIMLFDNLTENRLFLKGPLVIGLKEGTYNQVNKYYLNE